MSLRVTLCGATLRWVFPGSGAWDAWLSARPWAERGGVAILNVGSPTVAPRWVEEAGSAVRAADGGRMELRIRRIQRWRATATETLLEQLGLPSGSPHVARARIAAELSALPCVFVVADTVPNGTIASELEALIDAIPKLTFGARLCVVTFGGGSIPGAVPFTGGVLGEPVLLRSAPRDELFRRYLHARIAWESAGNVEVAEGLERRLEHATTDRQVEAALNEFAQRPLSPDEVKQADAARREALGAGDLATATAPWAARRMLLEGGGTARVAVLRHRVICGPLAREIASRCFELEAVLRQSLAERLPARATDEAERAWSAYREGRDRFTASLYPDPSPAVPDSVWAFASLGELLRACDIPASHAAQQVRSLRNAMAHGHYAGWAAVETLLSAEQRLSVRAQAAWRGA